MNALEDVIGLYVNIPGSPINQEYSESVTINLDEDGNE